MKLRSAILIPKINQSLIVVYYEYICIYVSSMSNKYVSTLIEKDFEILLENPSQDLY